MFRVGFHFCVAHGIFAGQSAIALQMGNAIDMRAVILSKIGTRAWESFLLLGLVPLPRHDFLDGLRLRLLKDTLLLQEAVNARSQILPTHPLLLVHGRDFRRQFVPLNRWISLPDAFQNTSDLGGIGATRPLRKKLLRPQGTFGFFSQACSSDTF